MKSSKIWGDGMQKITYINEIGKTLKFFDNPNILFEAVEGLERITGVSETSQATNQDGTTLESVRLDERPVVLKFSVKGRDYQDYLTARDAVLRAFNPKIGGVLYYENEGIRRMLYCKPDETPEMLIDQFKTYSKCEVNLTANDPMLYNQEESFTQLATWVDGLKFPFKLPFHLRRRGESSKCEVNLTANDPMLYNQEESFTQLATWVDGLKFPFKLPFHLRRRGESKINIYNDGHETTPVQIIVKGPAYKPTVRLIQTGEYIQVKRELTSDDTLYIDTTFGVNSVEIERDGVRENSFSSIDWKSDFFQLQPGDNMVEYTTENDLVPQLVEVRYKERFLGI